MGWDIKKSYLIGNTSFTIMQREYFIGEEHFLETKTTTKEVVKKWKSKEEEKNRWGKSGWRLTV